MDMVQAEGLQSQHDGTISTFQHYTSGADIIGMSEEVGLDPRLLYEAVIDLTTEGLFTASCINIGAGILLRDLGLPNYFFQNISKESLKLTLGSISSNISFFDGKPILNSRVAHVNFALQKGGAKELVRIATSETRDFMEAMLENAISGHRREYYYNPETKYYTYIIRPETVRDFSAEDFSSSRFLFHLAGDFAVTPEPTRQRYTNFLETCEASVHPLVQVFNLPESGETRFMFDTNFESPQLPLLRKILHDHGLLLSRAYWEPYRAKSAIHAAVCSFYVQGELSTGQALEVEKDILSFLAWGVNSSKDLYINDQLTFDEMLFAGICIDFTRLFIFKESENVADRELMDNLSSRDHKDVLAARIQRSNKAIYRSPLIEGTVRENVDLIKFLYQLFEAKFHPTLNSRISNQHVTQQLEEFRQILESRFLDFPLGYDIFHFMGKIIVSAQKTNFYKEVKRSFSFRFDSTILDPLVFDSPVFGIYYVNGHYSSGTHLRADDIARGGLRLVRVSRKNYESELDNTVLLNYALGPKAQRLKHKDICESGAKGVIVPRPHYAGIGFSHSAVLDYTEGIVDLLLPDRNIIDYYGTPEMVFFGPDEGTAQMMDSVAENARLRGYKHWRTLTTGKSMGIPHDTYGLLENGDLFGLFDRGVEGVELQRNGETVFSSTDMERIYEEIGGTIRICGMTTTSVMSSFRTLIEYYGAEEEKLNLMITGGPDGDLGGNQIQCYKGKICLIIDAGGVLFDPNGLDKKELTKLAFKRNLQPRPNTLHYPVEKLSDYGFMVPLIARNSTIPGGIKIDDGALFHRSFLTNPTLGDLLKQADIKAFIPCGGFKDTINRSNVELFTNNFRELQFIVEGANVFFDDAARRHIALTTDIQQIKDSSANKGGVFSSSVAEVLTPFLLGEKVEELLANNVTRTSLIRDVIHVIETYSRIETRSLLNLHENGSHSLVELSEMTSELIFAMQQVLTHKLSDILRDEDLVWSVLEAYIPPSLVNLLGRNLIVQTLNSEDLQPYRDAIITKKVASLAFYKFHLEWDNYLETFNRDFRSALQKIFL